MKKQTELIFRPCAYLYRLSLLALVATSSLLMLTPSAAGRDLKVAEASAREVEATRSRNENKRRTSKKTEKPKFSGYDASDSSKPETTADE